MIALALLLALGVQDEMARWVEKLGSDSVVERESAMRRLQDAGPDALPALEAAARSDDPELKFRAGILLRSIPKLAALSKVFGPVKRITYEAVARPLEEVTVAMSLGLDESIRLDGLDRTRPTTVAFRDTPMWEALDLLARAVGGRYEYRKDGVVYRQGLEPAFPVRYYGQFRISLVEVQRLEWRSPGRSADVVLLVPEIQYQRNLFPAGDKYGGMLASVVELQRVSGPRGILGQTGAPWGPGSLSSRRPFGLQQYFILDGQDRPLTIEGTATARFARAEIEVSFPIEALPVELPAAPGTLKLAGYTAGPARTTATISGRVPKVPGAPNPADRVKRIWLESAEGRRHPGQGDSGRHAPEWFSEDYEFSPPPFKPAKVVVQWISEIHALDIPFLLEGVEVP